MMATTGAPVLTPEQSNALSMSLAVLDSLSQHIAIVNTDGIIVAVNRAWREFSNQNDDQHILVNDAVGMNYFDVCRASFGDSAEQSILSLDGMLAVLRRETSSFEVVYPCHSPTEERWFLMRVVPLTGADFSGLVVTHTNITRQKRELNEETLQALRNAQNRDTLMELTALADLSLDSADIHMHDLQHKRFKDESPKLFRELMHQYAAIILHGIEEQSFKIPRIASKEIAQFAERIGFMRLQARDVVDMHTAALYSLTHDEGHHQKHQALIGEGRIRLVELMGCMAMYYRELVRGKDGQRL